MSETMDWPSEDRCANGKVPGRLVKPVPAPFADAPKNARNTCGACPLYSRQNGWCPIRALRRADAARMCNYGARMRQVQRVRDRSAEKVKP